MSETDPIEFLLEELLDLTETLLPHEKDKIGHIQQELERVLSHWEPFVSEYRMVSRDGRVIWFRDEADWIKNEETIKGVEELMEKVYQAGIKDAATLIKKSFEGYDVF